MDGQWKRSALVSISPIAGPLNGLEALLRFHYERRTRIWISLGFVVLIKMTAAAGMLWLTVATFDRCLGRVREKRRPTESGELVHELVSSAS
jgi:hypothetical protein